MIATNNKGDECFEAESPDEGKPVGGRAEGVSSVLKKVIHEVGCG